MKSLIVCCAALAMGDASRLIAAEPKAQPPLSPTFVQVESAGKDENGDGEKLLSCVFVAVRVNYIPDPNKKGAYERVVTKELLKEVVALNKLVVTTAAGKTVDIAPEKLVGRNAVLQKGGFPLDPAVAKMLAPDTLILSERPQAKR